MVIGEGGLVEVGGEVKYACVDGPEFDGHLTNNASVTVTGAGSRWINQTKFGFGGGLSFDDSTASSLTVADGGEVRANILFAPLKSLFGDGVIKTKGIVLDGEFVVNSGAAGQPTIAFGTGGTLTLDATANQYVGAGNLGSGSMKVGDGVSIATQWFYLGYGPGSSGSGSSSWGHSAQPPQSR